MSDRAITYAIGELAKAGLIKTSASGPRRQIQLLIPDAGPLAAYGVRAEADELPAQGVHPIAGRLPAHSGSKARTRYAEIEGGRPPKAPRSQMEMSAALAAQRERQPFVQGEKPRWLDDVDVALPQQIHSTIRSSTAVHPTTPDPGGRLSAADLEIAISVLRAAGGKMLFDEFKSDVTTRFLASDRAAPADAEAAADLLISKLRERAKVRIDDAGLDGRLIRLWQPLEGARPI